LFIDNLQLTTNNPQLTTTNMDRIVRRSGLGLSLAGLLGGLFFWLTDTRFQLQRTTNYELIDHANQTHIGTMVGLIGSGVILLVGLWLLTRKAA
jgi:hypothetical protein